MNNPKRTDELATRLLERRRELSTRPDVSVRMRELSQSSGRNPAPVRGTRRPGVLTVVLVMSGVVLLAGAIVVATGAIASGLWVRSQLSGPTSVADSFYGEVSQRDYPQAYSYFSTSAKSRLAEPDFAARFASYDGIDGIVTSYAVVQSTTNGNHATLVVHVVRRGTAAEAQVQTLSLTQQDGQWRIDGIATGAMVPTAATPTS